MSLTAVIGGTPEAVTADRAKATVSFTTTNTLAPGTKTEMLAVLGSTLSA
jgi:hypothetical protein